MTKKYIISFFVVACLCVVSGCKHVESAKMALEAELDNSEYQLVNKRIIVSGVGESRNQQQARNKSRAAALDSAAAILRESVQAIAAERGFAVIPIEDFQFANTQTMEQRTTTFNNDNGARVYRSYQTLSVEIETPLKEIFKKLGSNDDYKWFMFLRDMDRTIEQKAKKQW